MTITYPAPPGSLCSEHITLTEDRNAFGQTLALEGNTYCSVLLIQPTNEWFQKQWGESLHNINVRNLLMLLEAAHHRGYMAAREEMRKALGING